MRQLPLAYGLSFGKAVPHWAMRSVTWGQFCKLLTRPAGAKEEALSYVLGEIEPGPGSKCKCDLLHRTKKTVVSRCAITLDADYCGNAGSAMLAALKRMGVAAAAHTTWSSAVDDERYRVVVPLSRDVGVLEYGPLARLLMSMLGPQFFDHTCDQASRLMYLPAAPDGGDRYWLGVMDGEWLDVDLWLDLAGGPDVEVVREVVERVVGVELSALHINQLRGMCTKMAAAGEGNRDNLLHYFLKCIAESTMDRELASAKLVEAAVYAGLDEEICWEKVGRVLG